MDHYYGIDRIVLKSSAGCGRKRMNSQPFTWANNTFADGRNYGCLDEFWHMTALYGTLGPVNAFSDASLSLDLFVGSPFRAQ
eukprot:5193776-Amphidinium_carterae.3